jgi:GntR family histidine utilization transcriptional repressor
MNRSDTESLSTPRYREIHDALREKIVTGAWPPGFKLPPEPELARSFDCARMTLGKALGALAERGFITRRRRAGTIVNAPRPQESVLAIHDIEAEIRAAGHEYQYLCLDREARPATADDAAVLNVPVRTPVLVLNGIHRADNRPHALEERVINLVAVPDARRERFTKSSPGRWLLTRIPWTEAEHQISALNASATIAECLQIARNKACLCIERRTWLKDRSITYVRLVYPCDQHRLTARFQHGKL